MSEDDLARYRDAIRKRARKNFGDHIAAQVIVSVVIAALSGALAWLMGAGFTSLGFALGGSGTYALLAAGYYRWRAPAELLNEASEEAESLRAQLAEAIREVESNPADQLEALAQRAEALSQQMKSGQLPKTACYPAMAAFDQDTTDCLLAASPRHLILLGAWQDSDRPEDATDRDAFIWRLGNTASALREIAERLRARAGEPMGPQTRQRAFLKDALLLAYTELQDLWEQTLAVTPIGQAHVDPVAMAADLATFRGWDAEFSRLLHTVLPDEVADGFVARPFDMTGRHNGGVEDEVIAILGFRTDQFSRLQRELGSVDLRANADVRDWTGRWQWT